MIKNNGTIKIWGILIFFALSYDAAFANWPGQGTMVEGYHMMGTGMGWMMFLFWGLVLGILILVLYWVLNLPQRGDHFSETQTNASKILKERFAKGEIDMAEFELKKQIIAD